MHIVQALENVLHNPDPGSPMMSRPGSPDLGGIPCPGDPFDALDDQPPHFDPVLDDLSIALKYINALKAASLDDENLGAEVLDQIRNPFETPLSIDDPDERLSIDIFLSVTNASEETYNSTRAGICRRYPDSGMLTYHQVKRLIAQLTGIIPIIHDMCINSCIAYTGPYATAELCPTCAERRYDPLSTGKIPRMQFHTMPLAPQLQALWRTPEGADSMGYRARCTDKVLSELQASGEHTHFTDFFHGMDYLNAVQDGRFTSDDMVLMLSIDGAQLYRSNL